MKSSKMNLPLSINLTKTNNLKQGVKHSGFHVVQPDPTALAKLKEDYSFHAFGVDVLFIGEMCRGTIKTLKDKMER